MKMKFSSFSNVKFCFLNMFLVATIPSQMAFALASSSSAPSTAPTEAKTAMVDAASISGRAIALATNTRFRAVGKIYCDGPPQYYLGLGTLISPTLAPAEHFTSGKAAAGDSSSIFLTSANVISALIKREGKAFAGDKFSRLGDFESVSMNLENGKCVFEYGDSDRMPIRAFVLPAGYVRRVLTLENDEKDVAVLSSFSWAFGVLEGASKMPGIPLYMGSSVPSDYRSIYFRDGMRVGADMSGLTISDDVDKAVSAESPTHVVHWLSPRARGAAAEPKSPILEPREEPKFTQLDQGAPVVAVKGVEPFIFGVLSFIAEDGNSSLINTTQNISRVSCSRRRGSGPCYMAELGSADAIRTLLLAAIAKSAHVKKAAKEAADEKANEGLGESLAGAAWDFLMSLQHAPVLKMQL
jgi:hypothetical protein